MASEITKLYKESGGQYVPISPEISLEELTIGQDIADLWNKKSSTKVEAKTSLKEYLEVLTDVATTTVSGKSGTYVIGVTTEYTIVDTAGVPDAKTKWYKTYQKPNENFRYAWKREATVYQNPDSKATYTQGFYINANGDYIGKDNTAKIPWVYSFCGSLGQTGGAGTSVTYTVYINYPTNQVPIIKSDREAKDWDKTDYAPSGWTYTQPNPQANYSIWKSTRAWLNSNEWTDFTNPVRIYTGETTGSCGTFVVYPDEAGNSQLILTLNSDEEVYYEIEFLNMVEDENSLTIDFINPVTDSITIIFPAIYLPYKYAAEEDITIIDNNGNTLIENTDYTIDLKGYSRQSIQWINCTNTTVQVYKAKDHSDKKNTLSLVRTGMDGYFSTSDSSGCYTLIGSNSIKNTVDENSSRISGSSVNLCYGGACTEEACNGTVLVGNTKYNYIFLNGNSREDTSESEIKSCIPITNGWVSFYLPALQEGTYTISCYLKATSQGELSIALSTGGNTIYPESYRAKSLWKVGQEQTEFKRVAIKVQVDKGTNALFLKGKGVSVSWVQVEVGIAATNYHDFNTGIISGITQKMDEISLQIQKDQESLTELEVTTDTINSRVTNLGSNLSSYLKVTDGEVKIVTEGETCDVGLFVTKDKGSKFKGAVVADAFVLSDITNTSKAVLENQGILYFVTSTVAREFGMQDGKTDIYPVMMVKLNNKYYYQNLTLLAASSGTRYNYENPFYEIKTTEGGVTVTLVDTRVTTDESGTNTYYSEGDVSLDSCTYYDLESNKAIIIEKCKKSESKIPNLDDLPEGDYVYIAQPCTIYKQETFTTGKPTLQGYVAVTQKLNYTEASFIRPDGSKVIIKENQGIQTTVAQQEILESTIPVYEVGTRTSPKQLDTGDFIMIQPVSLRADSPTITKYGHTLNINVNLLKTVSYYDISSQDWKTLKTD